MSKGTIKKVAGPLVIASGMRDANYVWRRPASAAERLISGSQRFTEMKRRFRYMRDFRFRTWRASESMDVPLSVELGPGL